MSTEDRVLRLAAVKDKTGLCVSAIYKQVQDGTFPKPIPLGIRTRGWLETEIDGWIAQRRAERDARVAP
jgi:prophage regulatory protein